MPSKSQFSSVSSPIYRSRETVCEIHASDNGRSVVFPVATDDIVIVTVGSPVSGSLFGSNGVSPPGIQAAAETLLNWDWSIWFNLAAKSTKFGNPSTFCTQISESLLETFTATFPAPEFKVICAHITHALPQDRHLISVADSNWSLKIVLPQQPAFTGQRDNLCFLLGYALTPKECGNFIKKPMCVCSGDEILAELLWHFNIPFQSILPTATAVPRLMPFGLSPLLKRRYGDRPNIIPRDTTNIALVGHAPSYETGKQTFRGQKIEGSCEIWESCEDIADDSSWLYVNEPVIVWLRSLLELKDFERGYWEVETYHPLMTSYRNKIAIIHSAGWINATKGSPALNPVSHPVYAQSRSH
ncbi:uncharacterized protein N7496_002121 [Penicillium cataractarum]|uniref:Uncharacterized protein n=1 Tax=Penicillium cataractarum TaxID=2100454 RepID=A0A9W9SNM6_9EURO|nr:uncharacterized protein N7496_002121 [Penicillium cataractarum]KAJ5379693.1 hypothetical protein N7496_002121 [Penicillium cataractarum]